MGQQLETFTSVHQTILATSASNPKAAQSRVGWPFSLTTRQRLHDTPFAFEEQ